jgi:hypothetical protein
MRSTLPALAALTLATAAATAASCGGSLASNHGDAGVDAASSSSSGGSSSGGPCGTQGASCCNGTECGIGLTCGGGVCWIDTATSSSGSGGGVVEGDDAGPDLDAPVTQPTDGGFPITSVTDSGLAPSAACMACFEANCSVPGAQCWSDPNVSGSGESDCVGYVSCTYYRFVEAVVVSDAGAAGLGAELNGAQAACASWPASSMTDGNVVLGCMFSNCAMLCLPQ